MLAVTATDDHQLQVVEQPDPVAGAGELLVKVHAAGINAADLMQIQGHYPAPAGSPAQIPGLELAGEVVATGPRTQRFRRGDRVLALVGGGAQAQLAVVPEQLAMPIPAALDWRVAGAVPEAFITAFDALFTQAKLSLGERLLVQGAAGGVGCAAIALAVAAGAEVTATVRRSELHPKVAQLGATVITVEQLPEQPPFAVILELVGAPNWPMDQQLLAAGGRIVVIGIGAGARVEMDLLALMGRGASVHGSTLRSRSLEAKATVARELERHVLPLFERGLIQVPIEATYPLAEAAAAYEHFARPGKFGKLVLLPDTAG